MGVENGISSLAGDVSNDSLDSTKVVAVQSTGHFGGDHTLHKERNTEGVHASVEQNIDGTGVGESVVGALGTGNVAGSEFSTGLTDTSEQEAA